MNSLLCKVGIHSYGENTYYKVPLVEGITEHYVYVKCYCKRCSKLKSYCFEAPKHIWELAQ